MNVSEIVRRLEIANVEYRNGTPILTDEQYDQLKQSLIDIDPNHPFLHKVEEEHFSKPTVKHPFPMLSTDKAYSIDELKKFFNRIEKQYSYIFYKTTPKLDGLAARYYNGKLCTRGDGEVGFDITDAFDKGLRIVNDEELDNDTHYLGEIVMNQKYFDNYLSHHFTHPRNVVVGGVKSDDLSELQRQAFEDGAVMFVPYSKLPCSINTSVGLTDGIETIIEQLSNVPFPIDGFVIEIYGNEHIKEELGHTSHHYRWQIAYKIQTEMKRTTVLGVTWQTGRGGNITPVLEVEPVSVSGATVRRVTAHNYGFLKEKGIDRDTEIEIIRSGEVIPKVVDVYDGEYEDVDYPYYCPICNEDTILVNDIVKCPNFDCPAQVSGRLRHFFKSLKIDLFGTKTIEKLVDHSYDSLISIFNMSKEDFERCGFGPGQSKNLFNSIQQTLRTEYEDWKLLAALSIPLLGKSEAKKLMGEYKLEELLDVGSDPNLSLEHIEGFGPKKAESVYEGLKKNSHLIEFLLQNFIVKYSKEEVCINNSNNLENKKFVFTGKMNYNRDEMMNLCEQNGGVSQKSINKSTDYLVFGENVGKSKLDKAKKYGTMIIDEDDFMNMIKE
jgi:DNA ligase (NAD+)